MQYVKLTVRTLLPVALGLVLLAPVAQAANYNPDTTIIIYIHGFDLSGWNSTWLAGDDSENSDACGMWNDLQNLAALMHRPTWAQNPTAPNCCCAATYYGSTLPSWYTAADIAADAAANVNNNPVPQYALREAKYIKHCLNRAPGATGVHIFSASFGGLITRYIIEHNLLNLCSDGLIARWTSVVGVLRGNWAASLGSTVYGFDIGTVFGVKNADDPDLPDMDYSWVDSNISAHDTMNSAYLGPIVFYEFTADNDGTDHYITLANNNANDTVNMNTDEQFAGYTTTAALHPALDGTLQMPGVAYYPYEHTTIRQDPAMWASLVASAQNNKRFTITLTRLKALVGTARASCTDDGNWVYDAQVYSPQSAALYGNSNPVSDLDWQNGVSPTFSLAQGDTAYPNTPVFDMILPPGETQVQLVFSLSQLVNQYYYYGVIGTGSNPAEGQWTLTFSTTNTSTVTVSNGNAEADFSTSIHYVCYQPPVLPQQANRTVAPLTLVTVTNTATNFNPPGVVLSYQLLNAPNGASIDNNGVIAWTPNAAQGSTAYPITTVVSDGTSSVTNSFVVNVVAPTITCPANVTVNADSGHCYATGVALGTPATTGIGVSVGNDAPAQFSQGATTVTWTATDSCGNTATCAQTVTVIDNQPPSITSPANVTVNSDSGHCYATGVALGTPATGDNCGGSISVWNNAPARFEVGTTTVTWTAQDASGNTATCAQTVTVLGGTDCYEVAGCTVFNLNLGTPVTGDNCGGSLTVTNDAPAVYPLGTTIVTWTVTDAKGNTATATQRVNVRDRTPPTIICPANVTVSANAGSTATNVALGIPVTADNCSVASVTNNALAVYPLGTNLVTWTVTDGSGNTATCTQRVIVRDTTAPTISCPADVTVSANAGCTATNVTLGNPTTSDNCSVASVTNNAPAVYPLGTNLVTWTVTDGSGNTATCTQRVIVRDTTAPTISCPADVTVSANAGSTATNVALGIPVTADNCSVASVTNNAPAVYPLGTNLVAWTVTDGSGNTATGTQTVTVVPASVPPGNPTISHSGGGITVTWDGGVLQQSDNVLGPYTDVEGATSPQPVVGTNSQKFYRVRGTGP